NRDAMTIFIRFAMAESVVDIDGKGSFQNQTEDVASSSRSAARKVASAWKELLKKKPRGRYFANTKPVSDTSAEFEGNRRRSTPDIAADATKELESLAGYMPDLSDTDARVLALRLYFIELADGVSPSVAQDKVSK
ncbi:hypothetical protein EMCRGX_G024627, partial [Ephydatia muelleri]